MRRAAEKETARDAILDAADRLVARYGYKKMTMDDLAEEAGIGKGTLYLHFKSKEEIALAVCERYSARIREKVRAIARATGTPAERLKRMLIARIMLRVESVQHIAQRMDEIISELRISFKNQLRQRLLEQEAQVFAEVLIEGRLSGEFDIEEAFETALALLWATNALAPFNLSAQELSELEAIRARVTRIADLLLNGLRCRAEAKAKPVPA